MTNKTFQRVFAMAGIVAAVSTADAANKHWTNTAGGSWETAGNWNPSTTPTNTDSIFINANGTYTVNFDNTTVNTGTSNDWLTVFETRMIGDGVGGTPTLLVDFTDTSKQLTLLYPGGDALQALSGGNLIFNNGKIGIAGGYLIGGATTGTATMTGGTLTMGAGSSIGKFGTFTQSGGSQAGTVFFVNGLLNLLGGTHTSSSSFILGNSSGEFGTLLIDGGALTNTATFYIGNSGRGLLVISNGTFRGNNMSFGDNAGFGSGGDWNIYGGNASLGGNLTIGTAGQSTGAVLVAGGSLSVSGTTTVGSGGKGTLILNNGTFNAVGVSAAGPEGRFEINGGTATLSGALSANSASTGTIVSAGGILTAASSTIGGNANGRWLINGGSNVISGSLSLADSGSGSRGSIIMNGGTLDVGGTIYYNSGRGAIIVSNGTFRANAISMGDNGGLGAGGDLNVLGGSASVAGTLRVGNQSIATGSVLVANSGLLEIKSSITLGHASSGLGTITNRDGGTLRFTGLNNPTLTINAGSTAVMNNAHLEFKDATAANILGNITNIIKSGDNTLILNNATNAILNNHTFQTNNGQNFAHLRLTDGGPRWQIATNLTVTGGGSVIISNGTMSARQLWLGNGGQITQLGGVNTVDGDSLLIGTSAAGFGSYLLSGGTLLVTNASRIGIGRNTTDTSVIGAKGTLTVSNGTFLAHQSSGNFVVGFAGGSRGEWFIHGGTNRISLASGSFILGGDAGGSTGVVRVANGLLDNGASPTLIGNPGYGNLTVSNGGTFLTKGITIGRFNGGDLVVAGGTVINSNGNFAIAAAAAGDRGTVLVNGGALIQTNATGVAYWGARGPATITVSNGTLYSDATIRMGGDPGDFGRADFNIVGGTATIAVTLEVGRYAGTGAVLVANSGILEFRPAAATIVGSSGAFLGSITNRDGGTLRFMANDPSITRNASGSLLTSDATIEFQNVTAANLNGRITNITYQGNNTLSLRTATNASATSYTFQTNSAPAFARLRLDNGRFVSGTTTVGDGGLIFGNGTVASATTTNAGTISPGFSAGVLAFTGDLTLLPTSVFDIELGGTSGNDYDQIDVGGVLTAAGTLNVTLINSFDPTIGNSFDVLDFTSLTGTFTTLNLPALNGGIWDTTQLYTLGILTVAVPEPSVIALTILAAAGLVIRRRR
jgi:T5SS/PEP-CTERM-associated repeat protein